MPLKSAPYWLVECDNCGKRASAEQVKLLLSGEMATWGQKDAAVDEAVAAVWTEKDGRFHCPACPPLDVDDDCPVEARFADGRIPCTLPKGHPEPHSFGDTLLPFEDETGGAGGMNTTGMKWRVRCTKCTWRGVRADGQCECYEDWAMYCRPGTPGPGCPRGVVWPCPHCSGTVRALGSVMPRVRAKAAA